MTLRSPEDRRLVLAAATVMCTMLYTIDSTIVNVALPHMQGSLQATQDQIAWVITSYIVVSAIATPPAGWLASRYGLRRVLSISVLGFTAGSMLCGFATSLGEMVAFRIVQGLFGAALVPLAQVALMQEYPREEHGKVMALWTMGVLVGPIIGPTLGGYLTDTLSWRWAFFINLPIGVLAYLGVVEGLGPEHKDHSRPFDWTGFVLLSLALGLFQLMLDRGQTLDWFESTEIVAEAFFAPVLFYMFIVHSATTRHPFVDPGLFKDRNFLVAVSLMFVIGLSVISPAVLLPSFLQSLQGYSPTQAGALQAGARWFGAHRGVRRVAPDRAHRCALHRRRRSRCCGGGADDVRRLHARHAALARDRGGIHPGTRHADGVHSAVGARVLHAARHAARGGGRDADAVAQHRVVGGRVVGRRVAGALDAGEPELPDEHFTAY